MDISKIGKTLVQVHLLESPDLDHSLVGFPEAGNDIIKKVKYNTSNSRIYINENQYFSNVTPEIWDYEIGGYKVCYRWLQERNGRRLVSSEQIIFMRIVAAIAKTIELQIQIDNIYPVIENQTVHMLLSSNNENETLM